MKTEYHKNFLKDLDKAKKTSLIARIKYLMNIVKTNPFEEYPPFKKLTNGYYSRRINDQHRLVYDVYKDKVVFLKCWGHYDD